MGFTDPSIEAASSPPYPGIAGQHRPLHLDRMPQQRPRNVQKLLHQALAEASTSGNVSSRFP